MQFTLCLTSVTVECCPFTYAKQSAVSVSLPLRACCFVQISVTVIDISPDFNPKEPETVNRLILRWTKKLQSAFLKKKADKYFARYFSNIIGY